MIALECPPMQIWMSVRRSKCRGTDTGLRLRRNATDDDGSCTSAEVNLDCAGNCLNDVNDTICDELEIVMAMPQLAITSDATLKMVLVRMRECVTAMGFA